MTTIGTDITQLSIEDVLTARLRAAEAYWDRCQADVLAAAVEVGWTKVVAGPTPSLDGGLWIEQTAGCYEDVRAVAWAATAARDAARQELAALRGEAAPVPYTPSSPEEIKRLAVVLWTDDDELDAELAVKLARLTDTQRFEHYRKARVEQQRDKA